MKVGSATNDILIKRRLCHELLIKSTVLFNVHDCLGLLTKKMTSKSFNSCGILSGKSIHHDKFVSLGWGKSVFNSP